MVNRTFLVPSDDFLSGSRVDPFSATADLALIDRRGGRKRTFGESRNRTVWTEVVMAIGTNLAVARGTRGGRMFSITGQASTRLALGVCFALFASGCGGGRTPAPT